MTAATMAEQPAKKRISISEARELASRANVLIVWRPEMDRPEPQQYAVVKAREVQQ